MYSRATVSAATCESIILLTLASCRCATACALLVATVLVCKRGPLRFDGEQCFP